MNGDSDTPSKRNKTRKLTSQSLGNSQSDIIDRRLRTTRLRSEAQASSLNNSGSKRRPDPVSFETKKRPRAAAQRNVVTPAPPTPPPPKHVTLIAAPSDTSDADMLECPADNCCKKYRHLNGLKYHTSHAHPLSPVKRDDPPQKPVVPKITLSAVKPMELSSTVSNSTTTTSSSSSSVPISKKLTKKQRRVKDHIKIEPKMDITSFKVEPQPDSLEDDEVKSLTRGMRVTTPTIMTTPVVTPTIEIIGEGRPPSTAPQTPPPEKCHRSTPDVSSSTTPSRGDKRSSTPLGTTDQNHKASPDGSQDMDYSKMRKDNKSSASVPDNRDRSTPTNEDTSFKRILDSPNVDSSTSPAKSSKTSDAQSPVTDDNNEKSAIDIAVESIQPSSDDSLLSKPMPSPAYSDISSDSPLTSSSVHSPSQPTPTSLSLLLPTTSSSSSASSSTASTSAATMVPPSFPPAAANNPTAFTASTPPGFVAFPFPSASGGAAATPTFHADIGGMSTSTSAAAAVTSSSTASSPSPCHAPPPLRPSIGASAEPELQLTHEQQRLQMHRFYMLHQTKEQPIVDQNKG